MNLAQFVLQPHYRRSDGANGNSNNNIPIRTLYIAPIKPNIADKVKTYFERFGEVESIRMHSKENFQYGFVQFKTEESARIVLSRSPHWISNCMVKAKPADFWHQTVPQPEAPNPLYVPPEHDSDANILNALNDDCLREIFQYFTVRDLTSVADVCVRFNQIATEAFSSHHKSVTLTSFSGNFQESLLRNFGSSIERIGLMSQNKSSDNTRLRLIAQHCSATLKHFSLMSFHFEKKWPNLHPNFTQLESLMFIDCHFKNGAKKVLSTCDELKKLQCSGCFWDGKYFNRTFSKIERASFNSNYGFFHPEFESFITLNPSLKCLAVREESLDSSKVIQSVIQKLPTLSELEIDLKADGLKEFEKMTPKLGQLNCLKVLKLNLNSLSVAPLMQSLIENEAPIEHMKLIKGKFDSESIEAILKMKQIRILDFVKCDDLTDDHIIDLAKELPQLEELHLEKMSTDLSTSGMKKMLTHANKLSLLQLNFVDDIEIDDNDYKMMLRTVQNRPEMVKLLIEIKNSGDKVIVPEVTLMENQKYLEINEEVEDDSDMSFDSSELSDFGYLHGNWNSDEDSDFGFMDYFYGHKFFEEYYDSDEVF